MEPVTLQTPLTTVLAEIAQRNSARSNSPWTCRRCDAAQAPPAPPEAVCAPCQAAAPTLARQQLPQRLTAEAGFPPRYLRADWALPDWLTGYVTNGRGLCLTGGSGVGKTTALCLLARAWCDHRLAAGPLPVLGWRFVSFPALVMQLQDAWRRGDAAEQTAYQRLRTVAAEPRLLLDDLGAEKLTDYVRQATYFLLNEREQWERPTYVTTNWSLAQLDAQFDSRISSRLAGMCDVRALRGADRRLA